VSTRSRSGEELLQELARGDFTSVAPFMRDKALARKALGLDDEQFQLAEIAALAAVDAPPASWLLHLAGAEMKLDVEQIVGALIAVTPIVGTPQVVSAAANIIVAIDYAEELDEEP
jgi:alkylhydroperoxidase/carboxymuconolactone decarboxylase family protein YurZ